MAKIAKVEGIGEAFGQQLAAIGIATTQALLARGATPPGRRQIAEQTGIAPALVLRWVNHVDLFRIKGVGEEYAELLEAAGVDTVPELARRTHLGLYQRLVETNKAKRLVRQLPSAKQVAAWVAHAKALPRLLTY